jgi:hypothetical protein
LVWPTLPNSPDVDDVLITEPLTGSPALACSRQ